MKQEHLLAILLMTAAAAMIKAHTVTFAPLMKHTHSHFRALMRIVNPDAILFTEMAHADAIVTNAAAAKELAVVRKSSLEGASTTVLQLGGRDPATLARAAQIMVDDLGLYTRVDLNCGCPSQIVAADQRMGAWLMKEPEVAAACVAKIHSTCSSRLETLSVKCRIGVTVNGHDRGDEKLDDQYTYEKLSRFVSLVSQAGAKRVYIHARVAILGQTPMQNRIPALQYDMVYALAKQFHPHVCIEINGGVESLLQVHEHARQCPQLAGSMIGCAAVNHPFSFKSPRIPSLTRANVLEQYLQYCVSLAPYVVFSSEVSRIVAPIYSLFEGEEGNAAFRRKLEKCLARGVRSPITIITEASKEIPAHVLTSTGFKTLDDVRKDASLYLEVSKKRVSPMHGLIV